MGAGGPIDLGKLAQAEAQAQKTGLELARLKALGQLAIVGRAQVAMGMALVMMIDAARLQRMGGQAQEAKRVALAAQDWTTMAMQLAGFKLQEEGDDAGEGGLDEVADAEPAARGEAAGGGLDSGRDRAGAADTGVDHPDDAVQGA